MITERLKAIHTPDANEAMERLAARAERFVDDRQSQRRRKRWTLWFPTGLVAIVIGVSPIGAAIADSVGDLAGIGDEPSQPISIDQPGGIEGGENSVAGVEGTPAGQRYEVATTTSDGLTCVYLSFPELSGTPPNRLSCITRALLRSLERNPIGPVTIGRIPTGRSDGLVATAIASPLVKSAKATFIDSQGAARELEVNVARIKASPDVPPEIAADVKGHVPLQFLVSFLSRGQADSLDSEKPIDTRGLDARGETVATRLFDPPAWTEELSESQR